MFSTSPMCWLIKALSSRRTQEVLFSSPPKATTQRLDFCFKPDWCWRVTTASPKKHLAADMNTHDRVVTAVRNLAVMEQEIINSFAERF